VKIIILRIGMDCDETENAILADLATMGDGETKVPEVTKEVTIEQIATDLTTSLMQAFMTNAMVSTRRAVRQNHPVHQIMELPCELNPTCPSNKLFVERFRNEEGTGFHFAYWDGRFSNTDYATREPEAFCMVYQYMREYIPPEKYTEMGLDKEEDLLEILQSIMKEQKVSQFVLTIGNRASPTNKTLLILIIDVEEIVALPLPPISIMKKGIPITIPFVQANPSELGAYFPIEQARYFRWPNK